MFLTIIKSFSVRTRAKSSVEVKDSICHQKGTGSVKNELSRDSTRSVSPKGFAFCKYDILVTASCECLSGSIWSRHVWRSLQLFEVKANCRPFQIYVGSHFTLVTYTVQYRRRASMYLEVRSAE